MLAKSIQSRFSGGFRVWLGFLAVSLLIFSCEDEPVERDYPRVRTLEVTNITDAGATFVAEVYDEGNVKITEHGFVWSLNSPDVNYDERVMLGSFGGTGMFEADILTSLEEGVTYRVTAFVRAGEYTVYGETLSFLSLGSGAPEIIDFIPKSAGWGDTVSISGLRFSYMNNTNKIHIEECICKPFFSSDTLLKFVLPSEVSKLQNSLSVSILGNVATAVNKLTFIYPEVYGFTPGSGFWGDTVIFTGRYLNFFGYMQSDGMVLNDNLLCKVVKRDDKSISFVIPEQLNTVTSPVSLSYRTFLFSFPMNFSLLPSEADSIRPAEGTWGTLVTLYGKFNYMTERNRVLFGDKVASIISSSTDSLLVRVPDDLADFISTVRYSSEPFTSDFSESFRLKEPEIIDFQPKQGYVGEIVTIKGRYFRKNATPVEIGSSQAIVKSANDSLITCYVPGDVHGECDVKVSLMGYSAVAPGKFKSTNHVITGITPEIPAFGETVTVSGTNFRPGMQVFLGLYEITTLSQTENEIEFIVPLWLPYQAGSLTAKYKNWDSYYNQESSFIYPDPFQVKDFTVTGVTPVSGVAGDILVISGTDFGSPGVAFGSVPGEVLESSSSEITVRVPPLSSGEHTVNVTVGGRTHASPVKYTHSGAWRQLADLPFLYDYGCAFDFGEEAYIMTGGVTDIYDKEIYRFNPATKGFTGIPGTFRSVILNPISCTLEGKGYMIGQKSTSFTGIGFEVFSPDNMTVTKLPDYPGTSIANPCIIADDSVIYAGCGKVAQSTYFIWYMDFWKYSPATNKWTRLADCPHNVSFSNHVFIDSRLLFIGFVGTTGPRYLLEYMPLTDTWNQVEITDENLGWWGLWDSKDGAKVSVVNNSKWYIGFGDWYQTNEDYGVYNPDINNRFYRFDPSDDSWETINNVASPPRTFALSFSIGGKIYIGGHQIYQWYDFWEYDPMLD